MPNCPPKCCVSIHLLIIFPQEVLDITKVVSTNWPCAFVLSHVIQQTLCNPMDCSLPGSSARGISQARILEQVAISFSRGSSQPMGSNPYLQHWQAIFFFFNHWATWEALTLPPNYTPARNVCWSYLRLVKVNITRWIGKEYNRIQNTTKQLVSLSFFPSWTPGLNSSQHEPLNLALWDTHRGIWEKPSSYSLKRRKKSKAHPERMGETSQHFFPLSFFSSFSPTPARQWQYQ